MLVGSRYITEMTRVTIFTLNSFFLLSLLVSPARHTTEAALALFACGAHREAKEYNEAKRNGQAHAERGNGKHHLLHVKRRRNAMCKPGTLCAIHLLHAATK
jgi:nickel-dependent lactate racemase